MNKKTDHPLIKRAMDAKRTREKVITKPKSTAKQNSDETETTEEIKVVRCERMFEQKGIRDLLKASQQMNSELTLELSRAYEDKRYLAVKAYMPVVIAKMEPAKALRAMAEHLLQMANDQIVLQSLELSEAEDTDAAVLCHIEARKRGSGE